MADLRLRVVAGTVSAGLTLGVAELLAAFSGAGSAPLNALGSVVIDHTPDGLREWAIDTFGTNDKSVLYLIMGVVALVVAGLAGAVERPTRAVGSLLLTAVGVIAAGAAVARTSIASALPTVVGVAVGIYTLRVLTHRIESKSEAEKSSAFERRERGIQDGEANPASRTTKPRPSALRRCRPRHPRRRSTRRSGAPPRSGGRFCKVCWWRAVRPW